jgi:hypothetical protein
VVVVVVVVVVVKTAPRNLLLTAELVQHGSD